MPQLVCDGVVRAPAEVASGRRSRARGLLGRDGVEGVLVLPTVRGVHTLGMRFAIDVAFVDRTGTVIAVRRMAPWRVGRTRWRARSVIEGEAGSFGELGLAVGTHVEVVG